MSDIYTTREFFNELGRYVPEQARVLFCQFRGDPNEDIQGKWRARVYRDPEYMDALANLYVCVSAMQRNAHGEFRRRKENFAGGLCLMIDDLGTGLGAKQPMDTIDKLLPSALIETSPENYQAVYLLDKLEADEQKFDALIRAFVQNCLLSPQNSGMDGINRVFRPPFGINGKPKYLREGKPWTVRFAAWQPDRRYSVEQIAEAFKLDLVRENRIRRATEYLIDVEPDRRAAFLATYRVLKSCSMLKREEPNRSGWIDIICPWREGHTDRADNGASIRVPDPENEYYGAFRCHHGHCEGKGWRDLTDWLANESAELIEWINEDTTEFEKLVWRKS